MEPSPSKAGRSRTRRGKKAAASAADEVRALSRAIACVALATRAAACLYMQICFCCECPLQYNTAPHCCTMQAVAADDAAPAAADDDDVARGADMEVEQQQGEEEAQMEDDTATQDDDKVIV